MPKNLSTIGGATELRFGKNCREDQADNSIVINASNEKIDATKAGGVYITPLELATDFSGVGTDDATNTFVAYNQSTHQLFRTHIPLTLAGISENGAEFSNTVSFTNSTTGLTVDSNIVVSGNVTCTDLIVTGNVTTLGDVNQVLTTNSLFTDPIVELGANNIATDDLYKDLGHLLRRPDGFSNVGVYYDESENKLVMAYTNSDASVYEITPTTETMNVHVYGKLFTESNVGVINTAPVHTLSVGDSVFIDDGNHSNVIEARGNVYTTGNVFIEGGLVTHMGGVNKKTYSHASSFVQGTTINDSKITLTFTQHVFCAKIMAQLIDDQNDEVSTMSIEIGGGNRAGNVDGLNISLGQVSIFGGTNTNPWSTNIVTTPTTLQIQPTNAFTNGAGNYSIFIEYISAYTGGKLQGVTSVAGDSATFGY